MIGIVRCDLALDAAPRVCGLTPPLRALLCMQAAGATALGVVGEHARVWLEALRRDDRLRVPLDAMPVLPSEPHVVIDGRVVIDTRAARTLFARPGVVLEGTEVLAVHRARHFDGDPMHDAGDGAIRLAEDGGGVFVVVRDAKSVDGAEETLMATLRKPQDGVVSRALNRGISLSITRLLCRTSLRPNQLSVGILGIGLFGAWLASRGTYGLTALGGVLFQAQSVLDGCDGELARITFRGSRAGEWIDTVGDDVTNYAFFGGVALGLHCAGGGALPQILGAIGVFAGVLTSLIAYLYLYRIGSGDLLKYPMGFGADFDAAARGETPVEKGFIAKVFAAMRPMFKRDFFVLATMLATVGGKYPTLVMLGFFAVGACITLVAVLRSEFSRRGRVP